MEEVQLLDRAPGAVARQGLLYTAKKARRSFWKGYAIEGTVQAVLCRRCGLVSLYAQPGDPGRA
jgi:hypothetical protein